MRSLSMNIKLSGIKIQDVQNLIKVELSNNENLKGKLSAYFQQISQSEKEKQDNSNFLMEEQQQIEDEAAKQIIFNDINFDIFDYLDAFDYQDHQDKKQGLSEYQIFKI